MVFYRMQRSDKVKRINKKTGISFLLLVFCLAVLTACGNRETTESNVNVNPTETPQATEEPVKTEEPEATKKPEDNKEEKEIIIYSINDDSLESEQMKVKVSDEITPEVIVSLVVEAFSEHSLDIGIDYVKQEDSNVIVSFLYDKAPLSQVGTDVEETILNSIADSLIDNVPNCKGVIFRAEGDAYESGHYAFGKDELYVKE